MPRGVRFTDGYLVILIVGTLIAAAAVSKLLTTLLARVVCYFLKRHERAKHGANAESPDIKAAHERRMAIVRELRNPLSLGLMLGVWQLSLAFIQLSPETRDTMHDIGRAALVLPLVWLAIKLVDLISDFIARRSRLFARHEGSRALLPLARRVSKVIIAAVAVVAVLGSLGYSVTGLIAGLGITGIAVALAAQKTLENVLGAFAIGIDQPLREGDFVKVDQYMGTVERIGLRSTHVRTLDRTLIAYPNGKLADSVIERFSARDRTRFAVKFRLSLATSSRQLAQIREGIEDLLVRHHDRAATEEPSVHLTGPGDAWFELEAMAWFATPDWPTFQKLRDQLLLDCLDIITGNGAYLNGAPPPKPVDAPPKPGDAPRPRARSQA